MSDLTSDEQDNVRAALRFMRAQAGTWESLAKGLRTQARALSDIVAGRNGGTARLVYRLARVAGVGIDDVLEGRFPPAGVCPYCGHRAEPAAKNKTPGRA